MYCAAQLLSDSMTQMRDRKGPLYVKKIEAQAEVAIRELKDAYVNTYGEGGGITAWRVKLVNWLND